jgi:mRNA-degrading endonuclease RelE of RelBE toxin-antitoxin system
MSHRATARFWRSYDELPEAIRRLADKNFALLKDDPRHPSLQLKKVGELWSARIGGNYRALALETEDGLT